MVAYWLRENKLTLNLDKTKSMIIGSNRKLGNISTLSLSIFDTDINTVSSFKYLGVVLSTNFTLTDHIEYISIKINKNLGLLCRIKHLLPQQTRLLFYNSLVYYIVESKILKIHRKIFSISSPVIFTSEDIDHVIISRQ